jgi:hypothetical protein
MAPRLPLLLFVCLAAACTDLDDKSLGALPAAAEDGGSLDGGADGGPDKPCCAHAARDNGIPYDLCNEQRCLRGGRPTHLEQP